MLVDSRILRKRTFGLRAYCRGEVTSFSAYCHPNRKPLPFCA